jgi:CRP-like cAMP-binding protein
VTQPPIEPYLATHTFFAGLRPEAISFLAGCARHQSIAPDEVVFRQGERAHQFYLIRTGRVAVEIPAITGPNLPVQRLGTDQVLGWSWLIPPYKWNFQARAEAPTVLLAFDGDAVRARCEADPTFGYALLKRFAALMAERLDVARQTLMDQWNPPGFA